MLGTGHAAVPILCLFSNPKLGPALPAIRQIRIFFKCSIGQFRLCVVKLMGIPIMNKINLFVKNNINSFDLLWPFAKRHLAQFNEFGNGLNDEALLIRIDKQTHKGFPISYTETVLSW